VKRLTISFVTSEVDPFSKTGGLADVSHSLPAALAQLGHDVTIFSPFYRGVADRCAAHELDLAAEPGPDVVVWDTPQPLRFRVAQREGYRLVFAANDALYDRDGLYGDGGRDHPDNLARFSFLCRAVLEYHRGRGEAPEILHANDWQCGLLPAYLRTSYASPLFAGTRSVFTVHNLAYQGLFPGDQLAVTGLDPSLFHPEALEFWGQLNLMKAGLVFADAITTVSPSYAEEIQTPEHGRSLDGVLRAQRHKLRGILNGIDPHRWDPAADPLIAAPYDAGALAGKETCKRALQRRLNLSEDPAAFVLGVVSRFDVQKGIPLVVAAFRQLAGEPVQLAVLGVGDAAIERHLRELAGEYPRRVSVHVGFDDALAHQIEAGADAFLMPSAYEPCGLNQMYSQRYGTIPIVHATGGLRDSVQDYSPQALNEGKASGFSFAPLSADNLAAAIRRALAVFRDDAKSWRALLRQCMRIDNTWTHSAKAYEALYRELAD
jgi:starch synthase